MNAVNDEPKPTEPIEQIADLRALAQRVGMDGARTVGLIASGMTPSSEPIDGLVERLRDDGNSWMQDMFNALTASEARATALAGEVERLTRRAEVAEASLLLLHGPLSVAALTARADIAEAKVERLQAALGTAEYFMIDAIRRMRAAHVGCQDMCSAFEQWAEANRAALTTEDTTNA
jgi:hypothetical protein